MNKKGNPWIHSSVSKVPVNRKDRKNFENRLKRRKRRAHFRKVAVKNKAIEGSCSVCFEKYNIMEINLRKVDLCVCCHHLCRGCYNDIMSAKDSICPECRTPLVCIVDLSVSNVTEEKEVYY